MGFVYGCNESKIWSFFLIGDEMNNNLEFTNKEKIIYLSRLIGKVFKVIPLYETNNLLPLDYVDDLIRDIYSANDLFNGILIEILVKINSIKIKNVNHKTVRKIILECTNIINKMIDNLEKEVEGNE